MFNLDFPDSNHLAKTLTLVSGPDTVNLTYYNFFASKEKVTQVKTKKQQHTPHTLARCPSVILSLIPPLIVETQPQAISRDTVGLY